MPILCCYGYVWCVVYLYIPKPYSLDIRVCNVLFKLAFIYLLGHYMVCYSVFYFGVLLGQSF